MSTGAIAAIAAAAAVVILLILVLATRSRRTARMRDRFGPEYDRTVEESGGRRAGERELADRQARHDELQLRALPPAARQRYRDLWDTVQVQFVDAPMAATTEAHRLVTRLMQDRGYPTEDVDDRVALLSVEHADVVDHYRAATRIADANQEGRATTEDLRQAMVHFRVLFDRLLTASADDPQTGTRRSDGDEVAGTYPSEGFPPRAGGGRPEGAPRTGGDTPSRTGRPDRS